MVEIPTVLKGGLSWFGLPVTHFPVARMEVTSRSIRISAKFLKQLPPPIEVPRAQFASVSFRRGLTGHSVRIALSDGRVPHTRFVATERHLVLRALGSHGRLPPPPSRARR